MSTNVGIPFRVVFDGFAEKHYIKDFHKDHKSHWLTTRKAIVAQFNNVDLLLNTGRLTSAIYQSLDMKHAIHKHSFAVARTKQSAKASGNRIIIYVNYELHTVQVLLVYNKNQLGPPNETAKLQSVIAGQFPEIMRHF